MLFAMLDCTSVGSGAAYETKLRNISCFTKRSRTRIVFTNATTEFATLVPRPWNNGATST